MIHAVRTTPEFSAALDGMRALPGYFTVGRGWLVAVLYDVSPMTQDWIIGEADVVQGRISILTSGWMRLDHMRPPALLSKGRVEDFEEASFVAMPELGRVLEEAEPDHPNELRDGDLVAAKIYPMGDWLINTVDMWEQVPAMILDESRVEPLDEARKIILMGRGKVASGKEWTPRRRRTGR